MNPIRAWNTFWFGPVSARPLGAFRVAFGVVSLCNLAFLSFYIDYLFTDGGLLRGTEPALVAGSLRWSVLFSIRDPLGVRLFFGATAIVGLLLTIGWHTRIMAVLFYLMMLSIHNANQLTASGADALMMIMTFLLMLCPSGAAFSLDAMRAAKRRGTEAEPLILPWGQRLIQLQLCLIYFDTAILKSHGASWLDGTALHYVLLNTEVGRPLFGWLTQYPLAVNAMTHGALLIEFGLAFLLWFRATRRWAIVTGIALHAAILVTINIPIFGEMMIAAYIPFLAPDELDSVLRFLNPMRWLAKSRASAPSAEHSEQVDRPFVLARPHWTRTGSVPTATEAARAFTD